MRTNNQPKPTGRQTPVPKKVGGNCPVCRKADLRPDGRHGCYSCPVCKLLYQPPAHIAKEFEDAIQG